MLIKTRMILYFGVCYPRDRKEAVEDGEEESILRLGEF